MLFGYARVFTCVLGDVGQHLVVDAPVLGTHRRYHQPVVLGRPCHHRVGYHGQAPGLLSLLV